MITPPLQMLFSSLPWFSHQRYLATCTYGLDFIGPLHNRPSASFWHPDGPSFSPGRFKFVLLGQIPEEATFFKPRDYRGNRLGALKVGHAPTAQIQANKFTGFFLRRELERLFNARNANIVRSV